MTVQILSEGTTGNCLLSTGMAEKPFWLALKVTHFHRELYMLNRSCQNRGKQLHQNVHVESPSQHKSKDMPNLKVVEGRVNGQVLIPRDLQSPKCSQLSGRSNVQFLFIPLTHLMGLLL